MFRSGVLTFLSFFCTPREQVARSCPHWAASSRCGCQRRNMTRPGLRSSTGRRLDQALPSLQVPFDIHNLQPVTQLGNLMKTSLETLLSQHLLQLPFGHHLVDDIRSSDELSLDV